MEGLLLFKWGLHCDFNGRVNGQNIAEQALLVDRVQWWTAMCLGKIGQRGCSVQHGHIIGEWGGPIGQRGNWWTGRNNTVSPEILRTAESRPSRLPYIIINS